MSHKKPFIFIAGPCVIESQELLEEVVSTLLENKKSLGLDWDFYFKASFDKANRSAIDSWRGPGIEKGCAMLHEIRKKYAVKVITDVHTPEQCSYVADYVDALQIPAFLCRQTDLVVTAAQECLKRGLSLNIKKGQFLAPWDMANVVEKVASCQEKGQSKNYTDWCWVTERGTSFGYNNLVVDMTSFPVMAQTGCSVIFDATHSVQKPGGAAGGKITGGRREMIVPLIKAATAVGIDGLFMETHPRVKEAKSDAANAFPLGLMKPLMSMVQDIRQLNLPQLEKQIPQFESL